MKFSQPPEYFFSFFFIKKFVRILEVACSPYKLSDVEKYWLEMEIFLFFIQFHKKNVLKDKFCLTITSCGFQPWHFSPNECFQCVGISLLHCLNLNFFWNNNEKDELKNSSWLGKKSFDSIISLSFARIWINAFEGVWICQQSI